MSTYNTQSGMANIGNLANQNLRNLGQFSQNIILPNPEDLSMKQLEQYISALALEFDKRTMDTPLLGPTRRMLQDNEALGNAWSEMMIIWKLIGEKK